MTISINSKNLYIARLGRGLEPWNILGLIFPMGIEITQK